MSIIPPILSAEPKAAYLAAQAEIDAAIHRVLASGRYILGAEVEAFEREFAAYLGAGAAVGVANGTDALELALRALGVGPGDRVATVANTVSATGSAIIAIGAEPVFVEIDPETMLMDATSLERTLAASKAIKAVIPVHLYGHPSAMPEILASARRHGVSVVEDCAQAHGAAVANRKVGTWGDLAAFSFYPTKNLAALGDGGAVTGNDSALVEKVRLLRQYGWRTRYVSDLAGRNSRLDELQAAILRAQLPRLDGSNSHRAKLAEKYRALLGGTADAGTDAAHPAGLRLPSVAPDCTHAWHQFVVRSPQRDALKAHLEKDGIHCAVLYPVPLHRQPAFTGRDPADLPITERCCAEVLSLPLHPGITEADVARVCAVIGARRAG